MLPPIGDIVQPRIVRVLAGPRDEVPQAHDDVVHGRLLRRRIERAGPREIVQADPDDHRLYPRLAKDVTLEPCHTLWPHCVWGPVGPALLNSSRLPASAMLITPTWSM